MRLQTNHIQYEILRQAFTGIFVPFLIKFKYMKPLSALLSFFLMAFQIQAQRVTWINMNQQGASPVISFITNDQAIINVSENGTLVEWGTEYQIGRLYYYPGKLDKYMGRVDYYGPEQPAFSGKVRYIGATGITYYSALENEFLQGKIKTLGSLYFEYYMQWEDEALRGKLKSAGGFGFQFYGNYEDPLLKGKLKSAGSTQITYYTSFDDKAFRGKLKSVDNHQFVYYSSFDSRMPGAMKTGFVSQLINGIKYHIRN